MNKVSIFILSAIFASCASGDITSKDVKVLKPLSAAEEVTIESVRDIVEDIEVVKLEMIDKLPLGAIKKVLIAPNGDMLVMSHRIFQYSAEGKAIRVMGEKGHASNEYSVLEDICIDYDNNRLLVLDGMLRVIIFDLTDGSFIKDLDLRVGTRAFSADAIVPTRKGGFYIVSSYIQNQEYLKPTPTLHEFNYDGEYKGSLFEVEEAMISMWLTSQNPDNTYILRPFDNNKNIAYRVQHGAIKAAYHIDFEGKESKPGTIYGTTGVMDIGVLLRDNSYKYVSKMQESGKYLSFLVAGPQYAAYNYLFNLESGKAYQFNNHDARKMPKAPLVSDNKHFYYSYEIYSEMDFEKICDPLSLLFIEKIGILDESENPAIIKVKYSF